MKKLLLVTVLVSLMAVPALANPTGLPDSLPDLSTWPAGSTRTTHQYWTFSGDHIAQSITGYNAIPEEVINPVPQGAVAVINAVPGTLGWKGDNDNGTFYGDDITVAIKLNNYEDGLYKIMWFDFGASAAPVITDITAHDGVPIDYEYTILQGQGEADFGILITPNPEFEEIHFTIPGRSGAWLDYIHVDTICVIPAPGAILLGGIGVTLVGWLRRRRTL